MKKIVLKYFYLLILFGYSALFAGVLPSPPSPTVQDAPGGNGNDADQVTTPINMYLFALFAVGCMLIFYFSKQKAKQKAN